MDRDAPAAPTSPAEAVPPFAPELVRLTGLIGLGLNAAAAVLGVVAAMTTPPPAVLTPVQLFLIFVGTVTAGAALSMRPDLWWAWALGAVTALLGSVGLPASWDSFPPLFRTMTGLCVVGTVVCVASTGWRVAIASTAILFHFSGIFAATTSPPPQPWVVEQAWTRAYQPYLNFVYLRNAYHFYSPDPGPASILAFCLKTETGTEPDTGRKQYKTQWVVVPRRPADVRDPLGLSYFRRLSITEHAARGGGNSLDRFEQSEMARRRYTKANVIPYHPVDTLPSQYRLPQTEIIRYVLPSYASHIILESTPDKDSAARTTVKVYRLEHQTMSVDQFRTRLANGDYPSPYHPVTYRPFFLGEFDVRGNLIDPQDELLYWVLPIFPRDPVPGPPSQDDPFKKSYLDYLSVHALGLTREQVLAADEKAGQVFDWGQLQPRQR